MVRFFEWVLFSVIFLITLLLGGCIINVGAGDASGGDPTGGGGGGGSSAAEQARQAEVDQYVGQVIYKGATVTQSLQTAEGDVVDGLDRSTLPGLLYPLPALPYLPASVSLPPGVTFGIPDFQQDAALGDLVAKTAGFHRPNFEPYIMGETDATSVADYLDRYEVGGVPQGNRLYAGIISTVPNRGVSAYINQFQPDVAPKSFSLIELAVFCPGSGSAQEVVGVAISVDRATLGGRNAQGVHDGLARIRVEYATTKNGKTKYVWDELDGMFVANSFRTTRPGQVVPVSALGGAQVEHLLTIFQAPIGDWWIAFDQDLLGYYPASLFTMLNGGACGVAWYGEVYNPFPDPNDLKNKGGPVKSGMGSEKFAAVGRPNVAYVRKPEFYDTSWFSVVPPDNPMTPNRPLCYTKSPLTPDPVSGDSIFNLGGPGGKDPGCPWPFP